MSARFPCPTLLFTSTVVAASLLSACATEAPTAEPTAGEPAADAATTASTATGTAKSNQFWWPEQVDLSPLRRNADVGPYGPDHDSTVFLSICVA